MSGYSLGWGMPVLNCEVCGARVGKNACHRHLGQVGIQILRDKYLLGMRILRIVPANGEER